mmetsp:Transcript_64244/g.107495  ORF Transcript_64244/g.107495 Transcript_64244/m.107495 type:complete len:454 (-) Transcript_64244:923-2284(-)
MVRQRILEPLKQLEEHQLEVLHEVLPQHLLQVMAPPLALLQDLLLIRHVEALRVLRDLALELRTVAVEGAELPEDVHDLGQQALQGHADHLPWVGALPVALDAGGEKPLDDVDRLDQPQSEQLVDDNHLVLWGVVPERAAALDQLQAQLHVHQLVAPALLRAVDDPLQGGLELLQHLVLMRDRLDAVHQNAVGQHLDLVRQRHLVVPVQPVQLQQHLLGLVLPRGDHRVHGLRHLFVLRGLLVPPTLGVPLEEVLRGLRNELMEDGWDDVHQSFPVGHAQHGGKHLVDKELLAGPPLNVVGLEHSGPILPEPFVPEVGDDVREERRQAVHHFVVHPRHNVVQRLDGLGQHHRVLEVELAQVRDDGGVIHVAEGRLRHHQKMGQHCLDHQMLRHPFDWEQPQLLHAILPGRVPKIQRVRDVQHDDEAVHGANAETVEEMHHLRSFLLELTAPLF